jgi:hypothetical protein
LDLIRLACRLSHTHTQGAAYVYDSLDEKGENIRDRFITLKNLAVTTCVHHYFSLVDGEMTTVSKPITKKSILPGSDNNTRCVD